MNKVNSREQGAAEHVQDNSPFANLHSTKVTTRTTVVSCKNYFRKKIVEGQFAKIVLLKNLAPYGNQLSYPVTVPFPFHLPEMGPSFAPTLCTLVDVEGSPAGVSKG